MKVKVILIFVMLYISACSPGPEPIDYGNDICEFCKMNITDNKYAAEIVTQKNKVFKFDSIECLFQFKKGFINNDEIHSEWVNDFLEPGKLINLKTAYFFKSEIFRSPMGMNVLSVDSKEKLNEIKNKSGGTELSYNEVFELANED